MSHKVFILDDDDFWADSIQESIVSMDRDAIFVTAKNVDDAKKKLDGHCSEFLYGVVDLHLGNNLPQDHHGEAFLKWLNDAGWLQRVSVLVFSHDQKRLQNLSRDISKIVTVEKRTASDDDNDQHIRWFVEKVLGQRAGTGIRR